MKKINLLYPSVRLEFPDGHSIPVLEIRQPPIGEQIEVACFGYPAEKKPEYPQVMMASISEITVIPPGQIPSSENHLQI